MSRCLRTIIVLLCCAVNGLTQAHADILIGSYSGDDNVRRQILSFPDDANGASAIPLRVMGGPNSGLIEPVSGVYEPEEDVFYVGDFRGQSVRVFSPSNTNGDPAPLRAIGPTYTGQVRCLAVDAAHDELLVISNCCFKAFDRNANGDVFYKRSVQ